MLLKLQIALMWNEINHSSLLPHHHPEVRRGEVMAGEEQSHPSSSQCDTLLGSWNIEGFMKKFALAMTLAKFHIYIYIYIYIYLYVYILSCFYNWSGKVKNILWLFQSDCHFYSYLNIILECFPKISLALWYSLHTFFLLCPFSYCILPESNNKVFLRRLNNCPTTL